MSNSYLKLCKDANLPELITLFSNTIFEGDLKKTEEISKKVHRRMMDLKSELKDPKVFSLLVSYFGYASYKNQALWDYIEGVLKRIHPILSYEEICDVLSGLSEANRTHGEAWKNVLYSSKIRINEASLDSKISVLKSLAISQYYDEIWNGEIVRDVLSTNSVNKVKQILKIFFRKLMNIVLKI